MDNILPRDWTVSNIAQVVEDIRPGFACGEKNVEEGFPHLRMNNIGEDGDLVLKLLRKVPREIVKAQNILQKGDLLICTTNSSKLVGKVALFDLPGNYAFSNHLTRIRPNSKKILGEFLKWNLWLQWKSGVFDDKCKHWVNQSTIPKEVLREVEIILPPLNEQRRILAKLEQLLAKVEASRERLNKIPTLLKRFRQSVLTSACSGRLTADWRDMHIQGSPDNGAEVLPNGLPEIPETWRWTKLPETGEMSRGKSRHRPRNAPILLGGSYPFIQTGDVAQSGGRITSHKQTYSKAGLAQSRLWPEKTVCITIAANIAESALLTYPACFPDSVVGIIADGSKCLPEYLEFFIRTAKSDLSIFAPATAQKNINIRILSDLLVPLPPVIEQQEIVRRVEALFRIADQIEERYKKAKALIDKLTQAILAKAFRGELVHQNTKDELASDLLKCIQEKKER